MMFGITFCTHTLFCGREDVLNQMTKPLHTGQDWCDFTFVMTSVYHCICSVFAVKHAKCNDMLLKKNNRAPCRQKGENQHNLKF